MQRDYNREPAEFAGFWVRLSAYVIDSIIVTLGLLVVRLLMSGIMAFADGTFLGGRLLFSFTLQDIIVYICGVLYFILCTYCTGTTVGKRLMNLRVVSVAGAERPTLFSVIYRETVGRFLCSFVAGVGYLLVGLDREKRGVHDILSDTRVIYAKKVKVYPQYGNPAPYAPGPGTSVPPGPYRMVQPESEPKEQ